MLVFDFIKMACVVIGTLTSSLSPFLRCSCNSLTRSFLCVLCCGYYSWLIDYPTDGLFVLVVIMNNVLWGFSHVLPKAYEHISPTGLLLVHNERLRFYEWIKLFPIVPAYCSSAVLIDRWSTFGIAWILKFGLIWWRKITSHSRFIYKGEREHLLVCLLVFRISSPEKYLFMFLARFLACPFIDL